MKKHLYLIKIKSGQVWNKVGKRIAVTYLHIPTVMMLEQLSNQNDKQVVRVGIKTKPLAKCKQPQRALFTKLGLTSGFYFIRNLTLPTEIEFKAGKLLNIKDVISEGDWVVASGTTKGRGFAGVMKRWGFKGGPRTHGQSDRERAIGSIGQRTDPGRVWKGKKMPGHMGNTVRSVGMLNIIKIDPDSKTVVITGLLPGANGGLISFTKKEQYKTKVIDLWDDSKQSKKPTQDQEEVKDKPSEKEIKTKEEKPTEVKTDDKNKQENKDK